jgi:hypothetical protein
VHFMDADRLGDREQQGAEQHDRRNSFQHRPEYDRGCASLARQREFGTQSADRRHAEGENAAV